MVRVVAFLASPQCSSISTQVLSMYPVQKGGYLLPTAASCKEKKINHLKKVYQWPRKGMLQARFSHQEQNTGLTGQKLSLISFPFLGGGRELTSFQQEDLNTHLKGHLCKKKPERTGGLRGLPLKAIGLATGVFPLPRPTV